MFNGALHKSIYNLFVFKFYFLLGGVNINIQLRRIQINEQAIHRKTILCNHFIKSIHHRMVQVGTFNKPVVHKKVLIATGLFSCFGFAHKTINVHVIRLLLHRYQFGSITISQYLHNALLHTSLLQMKNLLAITGEGEKYLRKRHSYPDKLIHYMP